MIELLHRRAAQIELSGQWLLERDMPGLRAPGLLSANGSCRLLRTADGWCALNLPRADDRELLPAFTWGAVDADGGWFALEQYAASQCAADLCARGAELALPVALSREAKPLDLIEGPFCHVPRRVIDLSALWAGPLCAALLARAGAEVVRIESLGRPDPTPSSSPRLDARLNGNKRRLPLDLRRVDDLARLHDEIAQADVLVTSARADALERLGIVPGRYPGLTWVAITGHGIVSRRVGFGDDCAVAGGLLYWDGNIPRFRGDALADPLTGFEAALTVLSGQQGLIDMAMARVAAAYAGAA